VCVCVCVCGYQQVKSTLRKGIRTRNIARFEKALTLAFDLLMLVSACEIITGQTTHHDTHTHTHTHTGTWLSREVATEFS